LIQVPSITWPGASAQLLEPGGKLAADHRGADTALGTHHRNHGAGLLDDDLFDGLLLFRRRELGEAGEDRLLFEVRDEFDHAHPHGAKQHARIFLVTGEEEGWIVGRQCIEHVQRTVRRGAERNEEGVGPMLRQAPGEIVGDDVHHLKVRNACEHTSHSRALLGIGGEDNNGEFLHGVVLC
jgi:hypothetical protein